MPFFTLRFKRQSVSLTTTETKSRPAKLVKRSGRPISRAKKPSSYNDQPILTIKEIDDIISLHPLSEYSRYPSESFPRRVKLDLSVSSSESSSLMSGSSRISLASTPLSGPTPACSLSSSFLYGSTPSESSSASSSIYQSDSNPTSSASSFIPDSSLPSSAAGFLADANSSSPASSTSQTDSNAISPASSLISDLSLASSPVPTFDSNVSFSLSPASLPNAIIPKSSNPTYSFKDGFRWLIIILLFIIIRVNSEFLLRRH